MSKLVHCWCLVIAALLSLLSTEVHAGEAGPSADRSLSPYFAVERGSGGAEAFPLQATRVGVAVSDVIADVTVTQVYENRGRQPLHARYVFPASTRAAVHGLSMRIGERRIEARIQEREQAKQSFERAKTAGKSASLLEEQRPNVFTMSVANVMPGDRVEVTLKYTELLVPDAGTYELVFPTVVGPRYSDRSAAEAPPSEGFVATPYVRQGTPAKTSFTLEGTVASAVPIAALESPSHRLGVAFDNPGLARFSLDAAEARSDARDFVLRYRLAGNAIQSGVSLFERGGENFFLLCVQPPERVTDGDVPPREYVFVVDISGSMAGFPLETAKTLLRDLILVLRPSDRFNVILFSGGSRLLAPRSLPATRENVLAATRIIDEQAGGGGTELLPALEQALKLSPEAGLSRSFVIVTDGYVSADARALSFVRENLGRANVFAFGIGSSVNRYLIEGLARAGAGEPFVVTKPADAPAAAARLREYVRAPVLTDVRIGYEGIDVHAVEPPAVPDVLAARPVVVFGKYRGEANGAITLSGVGGRGPYTQRFELRHTQPRAEHRALPYLWARTRIANLADLAFEQPSDTVRAEVTKLGLAYHLLTPYTSFVAVSETVRNPRAKATDVNQPLPLPAGVEDSAVGGGIESASEPELLACLVLALLAFFAAKSLGARRNRVQAS